MSVTVYIGVGSNLGDRWDNLSRADRALGEAAGLHQITWSGVYETRPVGGPAGQGDYLNAVLRAETTLDPVSLLGLLKAIEDRMGRTDTGRNGPRVIDLDLLLHGMTMLETPMLVLPHPRMHQRRFVLEPLAELAPHLRHPRLGRTVRGLLDGQPQDGTVLCR